MPQAARWRFEFAHSRASAIEHVDGSAGAAGRAADGLPLDDEVLNAMRLLWLHHVVGARCAAALAMAALAASIAPPPTPAPRGGCRR